MCWSMEASAGLVVAGAVATTVTYKRGDSAAIWGTMAYFTAMEALQVAGYLVIDDCGATSNKSVTLLSYLHIVFQPFVINWFAMELVPDPVKHKVRGWVYALCGVSAGVMLIQILPWPALGQCHPGSPLCGAEYCTVSGNWHIAWQVPYNAFMLAYDDALAGPILASFLTDNPNEMPAVWCLLSIAILCIGLSPLVRRGVETNTRWGYAMEPTKG